MRALAALAILAPVAIYLASEDGKAVTHKPKGPTVPAGGEPPPPGGGGIIVPEVVPGGIIQKILATDVQQQRPRIGKGSVGAATIAKREAIMLQAVADGQAELSWGPVNVWGAGYEGIVDVMTNALSFEGVRINATQVTQQKIADLLGACLLTPKVSDAVYEQAGRRMGIHNTIWYQDNSMPDADRMVEYNAIIEKWAKQAVIVPGGGDVLDSVGKDWVLCRALWDQSEIHPMPGMPGGSPNNLDHHLAANYGWQGVKEDPGMEHTVAKPWQMQPPSYLVQGRPLGVSGHYTGSTAHDVGHTDYSQTCRLMRGEMRIRKANSDEPWQTVSVASVITSGDLWPLLSWEGPLPAARHPRVAPLATAVV